MQTNSESCNMLKQKNKKYCVLGVLTYNMILIDNSAIEWIDGKDFSLASLAKLFGLNENKNIKAKITLEVAEEPCELCGRVTTGDKICQRCGKMICDECARTDKIGDRYCPICYDLKVASPKVS
jgi:hypothetical protein